MNLGEEIIQLRINFTASIENAFNIIELNENIIAIANSKLEDARESINKLKVGGGVQQEINNTKKLLLNLSTNPQIVDQKAVIREQIIVLFVGNLECFLGDFIRIVGKKKPSLFELKNTNEKIAFTQDMLREDFNLGDAILEHIKAQDYSLQDLKSSLDVFKDYLSIDISFDKQTLDDLIVCGAARNCIVHNSSKADRKYINQIRKTRYKNRYHINDLLDIDQDFILRSRQAITDYADQLTAAILNKEEKYDHTI